MSKWFDLKSWSILDFGLIAIFILSVAYITWIVRQGREGYAEYYSSNSKNEYAKNKYKCAYPCGYHRYQSNLCDPQQDELPITMPDPNAGIPPIPRSELTQEAIMFQGVMNGSMSPCGRLNFCQ